MAEITRVYTQSLPEMKFVGRCYTEEDRENGFFSNKWEEWFAGNLFKPLEIKSEGPEPFEDCNAFYGLCRCKKDEPFQYWIGVFMPAGASVPEGYDSVMMEAGKIVVCWVYGKEPDVYTHCCLKRLEEENYTWAPDKNGVMWMFERYVSPRFTEPDEKGNIILDMCYYVK